MTQLHTPASEYETTLRICLEHIDDARAVVISAKNMLNAFAEGYLDVSDEVFIRRANLAHNIFSDSANTTIDALDNSVQILSIASALVRGAAISKTQEIMSGETSEEV